MEVRHISCSLPLAVAGGGGDVGERCTELACGAADDGGPTNISVRSCGYVLSSAMHNVWNAGAGLLLNTSSNVAT